MKFSAVVASALFSAAWAMPQAASTITEAPTATSVSLTPQVSCIRSCPAGDVMCQASCVGAAHPNSSQAVDTTNCAAKCDQGDGSPAATEKFSQCVQACIASHFPTSQTVAPAQGSNAPNSAASTGAGSKASSGTGATPTATGSGANASGTGAAASKTGAANVNNVQVGAAGLAGLFMAMLAL